MDEKDLPIRKEQPDLSLDVKGRLLDISEPLHSGALCPVCGVGRLDYDGLLNLACPQCGFIQAGCFT